MEDSTEAYIRKDGSEYCIYTKEGEKLSCYPSREQALKRLRQIEYFKHMGEGEAMTIAGEILAHEAPDLIKYEDNVQSTVANLDIETAKLLIDEFTIDGGE